MRRIIVSPSQVSLSKVVCGVSSLRDVCFLYAERAGDAVGDTTQDATYLETHPSVSHYIYTTQLSA